LFEHDGTGLPPAAASYADSLDRRVAIGQHTKLIEDLKNQVSKAEAWDPVSTRTVPYGMTEEECTKFVEFGQRVYDAYEETRLVTLQSFRDSVHHLNKPQMFSLIWQRVTKDPKRTHELEVLYNGMFDEKRIPTPEPEARSHEAGTAGTSGSILGEEAQS
jgi:hypothetical protein